MAAFITVGYVVFKTIYDNMTVKGYFSLTLVISSSVKPYRSYANASIWRRVAVRSWSALAIRTSLMKLLMCAVTCPVECVVVRSVQGTRDHERRCGAARNLAS